MAVAVRASTVAVTAYTNAATTLTLTKPTGTASGDLLVAILLLCKDTTVTPTAPTGWTLAGAVAGGTRAGANGPSAIYYKVAGASEGASYAFTVNATTCATLLALTGANTSAPLDANPTYSTGTATTITAAAQTATAGALLITGYGVLYGNGAVTFSTPSGMTAGSGNQRAGNYHNGATFTQAITTAGSTGTRATTASQAGTTPNQAASVSIAPAAGGGGGSSSGAKPAAFMPFFAGF